MDSREERVVKELINLTETKEQLDHLTKLVADREASPGFIMDLINNLLDRLEKK